MFVEAGYEVRGSILDFCSCGWVAWKKAGQSLLNYLLLVEEVVYEVLGATVEFLSLRGAWGRGRGGGGWVFFVVVGRGDV